MEYFSSDFHFGHDREFIYKDRGFASISEHDETIIDNINKVVKPRDIIYFMGDFAWDKPNDYFKKINCNHWNIINGNHDKELKTQLTKSNILSFNYGFIDIKLNHQKITLCHYPMISWNSSHWNSWNLYGHLHSRAIPLAGKNINVSLDCWNNFPVSFDEIKEKMETMPNNWDFIEKEYKASYLKEKV